MNNSSVNNAYPSHGTHHALLCYYLEYFYPLYGAHRIVIITVIAVAGFITIPTVLLNAIAVFVFSSKKELRVPSNLFLLNTSICDFLVGVIGLPLFLCMYILVVFYRTHYCLLYAATHFTMYLLVWMSFTTTFLIAVDRHIAIFKPYLYAEKVHDNTSVYIICILVTWVLVSAINVSSYFIKGHLPFIWVKYLIPALVLYSVAVHISIWIVVRKVQVNTQRQSRDSASRNNQRRQARESRVARVTFFMLVSLCVTCLPHYGMSMAWLAYHNDTITTLNEVCNIIAITRCLANPIIYYNSKRVLRNQVRRSLRFGEKKVSNTSETTM